ncbi:MAG TPA: hypothetical protein VGE41_01960 [Verrucomicrobiae bacterium]
MPVPIPHFPSPVHAFVWRNWALVPSERMAKVLRGTGADVLALGSAMGLPRPGKVSADQWRRSYITIIKRNWHLLPYEQLLELLGWSPDKLAYTLREDDFLYVKLGNHKPKCTPLKFSNDLLNVERAPLIPKILQEEFGNSLGKYQSPLFSFVKDLQRGVANKPASHESRFTPRFCYSYFALYGDPLLEPKADPYPEGYLRQLAASGVNGVWLQGLLSKLAPFPWDPKQSVGSKERLAHLAELTRRASKHGIGVYLYLNEPRAMPLGFFTSNPNLKGVREGDHATLCTSVPEVQDYLQSAIAHICRAAPGLAGFFTISGSENLTNCWSHGGGGSCPRCAKRKPAEVIAELHSFFQAGIKDAGSKSRLLVWDWGWADDWVPEIIQRLPREVTLMSVSEWSLPIERGGVKASVGEYSISSIGPGPRAQKHWKLAKQRGLATIAKIQANNSWELSAVPYIPAVANVAQHAANLLKANVDGLMLGWTLGGHPSPNLQVIAELSRKDADAPRTPEEAMLRVARSQFGPQLAAAVVQAWTRWSKAFREFPFDGGLVYSAPLQVGPANLLWEKPTGFAASMVGFPYDDLERWRAVYPAPVYIGQLEKVADGFLDGMRELKAVGGKLKLSGPEKARLAEELRIAEAAGLHFQSAASQARIVMARRQLAQAKAVDDAKKGIEDLQRSLEMEKEAAKRLYSLQAEDSRLGFEASNQYYYVPLDLVEKVLNCRDLLDRWLPTQREKWKV